MRWRTAAALRAGAFPCAPLLLCAHTRLHYTCPNSTLPLRRRFAGVLPWPLLLSLADYHKPLSDTHWFARTAVAVWWAGIRGHISFGTAYLAVEPGFIAYLASGAAGAAELHRRAASTTATDDAVSLMGPLLASTWAIIAFGVLLQGALSPLLLEFLRITPAGHEPDENEHTEGTRRGLMGLLTRRTKVCCGCSG